MFASASVKLAFLRAVPRPRFAMDVVCQASVVQQGLVVETALATVSDKSVVTVTHHNVSGETRTYTFPVASQTRLQSNEMQLMCAGQGWALFNMSRHNELSPFLNLQYYALFVRDVAVTHFPAGVPTLESMWWASYTEAAPTITASYLLANTTIVAPRARSVLSTPARPVLATVPSTEGGARTAAVSGSCVNALQGACSAVPALRVLEAAIQLFPNAPSGGGYDPSANYTALADALSDPRATAYQIAYLEMQPPLSSQSTRQLHVQFDHSGGVPIFCRQLQCDGTLQRGATAAGLLLGVFGVFAFVLRVLPCCKYARKHRREEGEDRWQAIGRKPKKGLAAVMLVLQFTVVVATLLYFAVADGCDERFGSAISNPRYGCVERPLDEQEKASVFSRTRLLNADQVVSNAVTEHWTDGCPPSADSVGAAVAVDFASHESLSSYGTADILCQLAESQNMNVTVTNYRGSTAATGVTFQMDVTSANGVSRRISYTSDTFAHVNGNFFFQST